MSRHSNSKLCKWRVGVLSESDLSEPCSGGCGGNCKLIVGYLGLYEYCPTSSQKDQIGLQTRIVPLGLRGLSVGVTFTLERTQILVRMKCGCGASLVWAHEV